MRILLGCIASVALVGCWSAEDAPGGACPETGVAACSGAELVGEDGCVAMQVDDLPSWPGVDAAPRLTVTRQDPDLTLSLEVPLVFRQVTFEESDDPAVARAWGTWVSEVRDVPADAVAAPGPAASRTTAYRLLLGWNLDTGLVEEGRVEMLNGGAPQPIPVDLFCAAD